MSAATKTSGRSGPQTILVVDDDRIVRNSIKLFLEDFGYLVVEAENGQQGLDLVIKHHPDLLLLDLRMPGMNGLEVLDLVKNFETDLPVVVISGTGKIDDVVQALQKGAWDFLQKPIDDMTVLKHTVEKALERVRLRRENLEFQEYLEEKITQRTAALERAYNKLTHSELKYRSIYENLQDIYYETSLDGTLLEISPSAAKYSLYSPDELLGKNIWHLYANPDQRQVLLQKLQDHGRVSDFEMQLQDKNGRPAWFSVTARFHPGKDTQPAWISGMLRDISERKDDEKRLRASSQTLEALFNAAPLAIMAIDSEMKISLWNQAAEKMFGWTLKEIIGRKYPLAPPEREHEAQKNLQLAMAGEQFRGHEVVRQHKDGRQVIVNLFTAPLRDNEDRITGQIIILEDVSEIHTLRRDAERSSRLASLGELAAGVAHEINNPNGLILLNLPTLKDFVIEAIDCLAEQEDTGRQSKFAGLSLERAANAFPQLLGEIEDSARRIKRIVEDLKDFARQDNLAPGDWFDLNQSVEKAVRLTSNHLKKATAHFRTELAGDLPQINGSSQRIEQVIVNLLINACEALSDADQSILLQTENDPDHHQVWLRVIDQGRGIDPQMLEHITDPFFTTRREQGGTGLGLSVSARIVKEHQGRLLFSSEPGKGTIASFSLPVTATRSQG